MTTNSPSLTDEIFLTLRQVGLPVFVLLVIGSSLDQWLTAKMQDLMTSQQGVTAWIWVYGLLSILLALTFPLLALTWVVRARLAISDLTDLNQIMIETFRSWGKALSWSFLLIIPGLIKWLRYSFVPYIALELPAYQRGEVDALKTSEQLTHGYMLRIVLLMVVFSGLAPLILTYWDEYKTIWKTPLPSLGLSLVETILTVIFLLILRRIFRAAAGSSMNPNALPNTMLTKIPENL